MSCIPLLVVSIKMSLMTYNLCVLYFYNYVVILNSMFKNFISQVSMPSSITMTNTINLLINNKIIINNICLKSNIQTSSVDYAPRELTHACSRSDTEACDMCCVF